MAAAAPGCCTCGRLGGGRASRCSSCASVRTHTRCRSRCRLAWQARNPVAQDGDGYPDVLPASRSVTLTRPFAGGGRPPAFAATAALLGELRSLRPGYDIATD